MNADEFFEQHSIEEINQKTRISPISLRFIKNKEFDKLPRVKFIGFVRLIEKKYKVDLSDLIEEYENYFNQDDNKKQIEKKETESEKKEEIKEKKSYLWILVLILFILSAFSYFKFFSKKDTNAELINETNITSNSNNNLDNNIKTSNKQINNYEKKNYEEKNNTNNSNKMVIPVKASKNIIKQNVQISNINKEKTFTKEYNITILPNELVWFRAINIDNNKTKEFLTSKPKTLTGNYYIKFGHGNITVMYNDQNITPNTKKIIRILFKNGKYKYLKKPNEYEK